MLPLTRAAILPLDQRYGAGGEAAPPRGRFTRRVTGKDTEEETMTINAIEATKGNGERMLLLFASYSGREDLQRRAQEEAAIEAEDILMQAEEANALDPVG